MYQISDKQLPKTDMVGLSKGNRNLHCIWVCWGLDWGAGGHSVGAGGRQGGPGKLREQRLKGRATSFGICICFPRVHMAPPDQNQPLGIFGSPKGTC